MKSGYVWLGLSTIVLVAGLWWASKRRPEPLPRAAVALSSRQEREPQRFERRSASEHEVLAPVPPQPVQVRRRWHPRDPNEWQGMLVDDDAVPPCDRPDSCGLGRACKQGRCVACGYDSDCATNEACVLDHCVVKELVSCRRRVDCDRNSLCILSGYTAKPRGNEQMRSLCVNEASGAGAIERSEKPPVVDTRPSLPDDALLGRAQEALKEK